MTYDRDLRRARRWVIALGCAEVILGMVNLWVGQWTVAAACGVWFFAALVWLRMLTIQQTTRDLGRTIEAGLYGLEGMRDDK